MPQKDLTPYVRIAVTMPTNRKFRGASAQTKWLAVVGICWSVQNLTDGQVTPAVITALAGVTPRHAKDLVGRDVWHAKGHACPDCPQPELAGDVVIHDFEKFQDSAETVRENRQKKAEAGREANHIRWKHKGSLQECGICTK